MPEFDPYYIWLGIPREEQPPDHYRLLGIRKLETNPDVIANAAEQRATHVRSMQTGMRQGESQTLLNQIFLATRVLLDQHKKARYDNELAVRLNQVAQQVQPAQVPVSAYVSAAPPASLPVSIAAPPGPPRGTPLLVESHPSQTTPRRAPQRRSPLPIPGWLLGMLMAVIAFAALYLSGVVGPEENEGQVAAKTPKKQQPRTGESRRDKPSAFPTERKPAEPPAAFPATQPAIQPKKDPGKQLGEQPPEAPKDEPDTPSTLTDPTGDDPDRDGILEAVEAAKKSRTGALQDAEANLLKAFDDAIVAAAKAKEANVVEALVEQKETFVESGEPPTEPQMADAFKEYLTSRKQLDSDLNRAYKEASLAYAEKLMTSESKAIAEEGKAFVAEEKAELERLSSNEKPALRKLGAGSTAPLGTPHSVNVFMEAYEKEIEKADSQETSARFEQVMKDMPAKMDGILKGMTWTIRCPIVEVKEADGPGSYAIHIEAPEELAPFQVGSHGEERWRMRSTVYMRLKKEQALSVEPGQLLVITATPRFPVQRTSGEDYVFLQRSFHKGRERKHFQHFIEFSKVKMDLRPRPESLRKDSEIRVK